MENNDDAHDDPGYIRIEQARKFHPDEDVILARSNIQGYRSYRNIFTGSHLITELHKKLFNQARIRFNEETIQDIRNLD